LKNVKCEGIACVISYCDMANTVGSYKHRGAPLKSKGGTMEGEKAHAIMSKS